MVIVTFVAHKHNYEKIRECWQETEKECFDGFVGDRDFDLRLGIVG